MKQIRATLRLSLTALLLHISATSLAQAQAAEVAIEMPAQSLADALALLTRLSGASFEIAPGIDSQRAARDVPPVRTVEEALARMLVGTGLSYRIASPGRYVIVAAGGEAAPEGRTTGIVRVEADLQAEATAPNGSRDAAATEGSRSLAARKSSVATRGATAAKDVEKSVSVITRQQIDDQRLKRIEDVMMQTPGITMTTGQDGRGSNLDAEFYSRGFKISDYSIDGGAPISLGDGRTGFESQFKPKFDMSMYDRIEILRGANGIFGALGGGPGGVVSLQRKRPRDDVYWGIDAETQSHGGLRVSLDHSRPLREDGLLAGRFVVTREHSHLFYDPAWVDKRIVYANVEARLSPESSINAGFSVNRSAGTLWSGGLPRRTDGAQLGIPRDVCLCTSWSEQRVTQQEYFVGLDHKLDASWSLRAHAQHLRQRGWSIEASPFFANSGVPADGTTGIDVTGSRGSVGSLSTTLDVQVNGSFDAWGQRHTLAMGIDVARGDGSRGGGMRSTSFVFSGVPVDVLRWNPDAWPLDRATLEPDSSRTLSNRQNTSGAFADLGLQLSDRWAASVGLRYDAYRYDSSTEGLGANGNLEITTNQEHESRLAPPSLALRYALSPEASAYLSRAAVYSPQTRLLTRSGAPLKPITGQTLEAGVKRSDFRGTLESSVALYRTRMQNIPLLDPDDEGFNGPNGTECCYLTNLSQSDVTTGLDIQVAGALTPRWQITASYTTSRYTFVDPRAALQTKASEIKMFLPRQQFKVWTTHSLPASHPALPRQIGFGMNAQTVQRARGFLCGSDGSGCQRVNFDNPGRAVFNAMLRWQPIDALELQLNIDNLLDRSYYQTIGSLSGNNWYGAPRTFTLSAKWTLSD